MAHAHRVAHKSPIKLLLRQQAVEMADVLVLSKRPNVGIPDIRVISKVHRLLLRRRLPPRGWQSATHSAAQPMAGHTNVEATG